MTDAVKEQLKQWVLLALVAFLGGGGGASLMARPDPFTGTDGKEMEERLDRRITKLEDRCARHSEVSSKILEELATIKQQVLYLDRARNGM
jgi:hypothetical protein